MTTNPTLARQLVERVPDLWAPRMRILLSGRGGHNEGTVVAAWDDDAGTLVVRWDSGTRETPIADITRPWVEDRDGAINCVATRPLAAVPDLDDPATAGVLLARLIHDCGGLVLRALDRIEATDPDGLGFEAVVQRDGLGVACARALLDITPAAETAP